MKRRAVKICFGSVHVVCLISPLKQSPRIVAIILIAAAEKQIAIHSPQNWFPCIESVHCSNLARLTEIQASLGQKKEEIKNKEWETMQDNEGCFHLLFFFFFFSNQTSLFCSFEDLFVFLFFDSFVCNLWNIGRIFDWKEKYLDKWILERNTFLNQVKYI